MAAGRLKVLATPKAGQYEIPGHPEQPARILRSLKHLQSILGPSVFEQPLKAPLEKIEAIHSSRLIETVQQEGYFGPDTPGAPGIYEASLLSAGAALQAAMESLEGKQVFSLMRPPGHHATPGRAMGFCYFNSMAVAVEDLLRQKKARKVAVLDLDCHHGNGTEEFCLERPELLYVSLHQFPAYPGTGRQSRGNCLNYPLPPGTQETDYFQAVDLALEKVRHFKPDLVGVSMGFDTYEKDPLTQFGLVARDYLVLGKKLRELDLSAFTLLEGGYHDDLPILIEKFLEGWTA